MFIKNSNRQNVVHATRYFTLSGTYGVGEFDSVKDSKIEAISLPKDAIILRASLEYLGCEDDLIPAYDLSVNIGIATNKYSDLYLYGNYYLFSGGETVSNFITSPKYTSLESDIVVSLNPTHNSPAYTYTSPLRFRVNVQYISKNKSKWSQE